MTTRLWFDQPALQLIRKLAESKILSIVAGAGISVEAGLPTWETLVNRLLRRAATDSGLDDTSAEGFTAWTRDRESIAGAGAIGKDMLGKSFRKVLLESLYEGATEFTPGETSNALASLYLHKRADNFQILTTNYDTLLESALRQESKRRGVAAKIHTLNDDHPVPRKHLGVRHLHGTLTAGNRLSGRLILSDRDYALMQTPDAWQESFFRDHVLPHPTLFIGASLTDPNLLRYLHRSDRGELRVAVFARQSDAHIYDTERQDVKQLREQSQQRKWLSLGVQPVLVDYYTHISQWIWELEAATRLGRAYVGLDDRLASWWSAASQTFLSRKRSEFCDYQDRFHSIVADAFNVAIGLLDQDGFRQAAGEQLQMSLWVYSPESDSLINWASSDRVWRDPSTLAPLPIDWSSSFISVKAFCTGSMMSEGTETYAATRWNHVVGFPVYVHSNDGRLPVGTVTIASTDPKRTSVLHTARETVRNNVVPQLAREMAALLGPSG